MHRSPSAVGALTVEAEAVLVGMKALSHVARHARMKVGQAHLLDFICGMMGLIFFSGQWSVANLRPSDCFCFRGRTLRQ